MAASASSVNKGSAIKKWFEKTFPDMSKNKLNVAVKMLLHNTLQSLLSFMKKLEAQEKKSSEKMKESIKNQG